MIPKLHLNVLQNQIDMTHLVNDKVKCIQPIWNITENHQ